MRWSGRPRKACRHCQARFVIRPRGLCSSCYYRPGVRDLYPPDPRAAGRGVGTAEPKEAGAAAAAPTDARPGSEAKVRVLEERAGRNQRLWHPGDCGGDDRGRVYNGEGGSE